MTYSKIPPQAVSLQSIPLKSGIVLSEPLMGQAHTCSLFPGGIAMSYRPVERVEMEPAADDPIVPYLTRRAMQYSKPGYAIGYRNEGFTKVTFTLMGQGEYKTLVPSEEEVTRFRFDLAEKAKTDPLISLYLSQHSEIFC